MQKYDNEWHLCIRIDLPASSAHSPNMLDPLRSGYDYVDPRLTNGGGGVVATPLCCFYVIIFFASRNFEIRLLPLTYKAFIFASFGEKIVKMCYSTQKLFPVYLEALGGWLPPPI
jgi:hypothetical protein